MIARPVALLLVARLAAAQGAAGDSTVTANATPPGVRERLAPLHSVTFDSAAGFVVSGYRSTLLLPVRAGATPATAAFSQDFPRTFISAVTPDGRGVAWVVTGLALQTPTRGTITDSLTIARIQPSIERPVHAALAGYAQTLRFSPDGKVLAVVLKPPRSQSSIAVPCLMCPTITGLFLKDSGLVIVDAQTGKPRRALAVPSAEEVQGVDFSRDGVLLAAATGRSVYVWHVTSNQAPVVVKLDDGFAARAITFSPDGSRLAVGGWTGQVLVVDSRTGERKQLLSSEPAEISNGVSAIAYSRDGRHMATGHSSGALRWWNPATGQLGRTIVAHPGGVFAVAFTDDARSLGSIGADRTFRVWPTEDTTALGAAMLLQTDSLAWAAIDEKGGTTGSGPSAEHDVALARDRRVEPSRWLADLWSASPAVVAVPGIASGEQRRDSASLRPQLVVQVGQPSIGAMAMSRDGRLLATGEGIGTGNGSGVVKLWDAATGLELRSLAGLSMPPRELRFNRNGSKLIGASAGQSIVWTIATGSGVELRGNFGAQSGSPVIFAPDGQSILGHFVDDVYRWNAATGAAEERWRTPSGWFFLGLSASFAAYRGSDEDQSALHLLNLTTHQPMMGIPAHHAPVQSVVFDARETAMASCDWEGHVAITEPSSGRSLGQFNLPRLTYGPSIAPQVQTCMAESADSEGRLFAVAGLVDILIWDVRKAAVIKTLSVRTGELDLRTVAGIALTSDGTVVIAGLNDGSLVYVDVRSGETLQTIRPHARRMETVALNTHGDSAVTFGDRAFVRWSLSTARLSDVDSAPRGHSASKLAVDASLTRAAIISKNIFDPTPLVYNLAAVDADTARSVRRLAWMTPRVDTSRQSLSWPTAISEDGALVLTGVDMRLNQPGNGTVQLWKANAGSLAQTFATGMPVVRVLRVSGKYGIVAAASDTFSSVNDHGSTVDVWRLKDGSHLASHVLGTRSATALAIVNDQTVLCASGGSSRITISDALSGAVVSELRATDDAAGGVEAVAFSADGTLLAAGYGGDAAIRLWDVRRGTLTAVLRGHLAAPTALAFSSDGSRLISGSPDGTSRIWDVARAAEIVFLAASGDRDHVIATTANFYTASRDGARAVGFRVGDRAFPLEQFDLQYNRPDVVLQTLGNGDSPLVLAYRTAYESRLARENVSPSQLGAETSPPAARILSTLPLSTTQRTIRVPIAVRDSTELLDRLDVYVNDVPLNGSGGIDLRRRRTRSLVDTVTIELAPGRNKIQVSARNARGVEAIRATADVAYTGPVEKPDLYVVVVGVSAYADSNFQLRYAAKDARDLAALWNAHGQRFAHVYVDTLLDARANRDAILAIRKRLLASRVEDQVVLFFAGHGILDSKGAYYFAPVDMDFGNPAKRGVSYDQIEELLDGIPARRKLLLLDTCHAGELDRADVAKVTAPTAVAGGTTVEAGARGWHLSGDTATGPGDLLAQLFPELRRGSGATVIGAAGGKELAGESAEWGNGAFTYAVRRALESSAADRDRDGVVRVSELRDYVGALVEKITKGKQKPVLRRENLADDFPVF